MPMFKINDMTCGHCVASVEKAVKGVDASAVVKIDLGTHLVDIQSGKAAEEFAAAIDRAGYTGELQA
jgi:copper chaperone